MEALSTTANTLALQPSAGRTPYTLLRVLTNEQSIAWLTRLMAEAIAMKPNTELQDATTDLYLVAWEDLVTEYGQDRFRAALWKALRKTEFFPSPNMIETFCLELRAADREQARIAREAAENPELVQTAPHTTRVRRMDETAAARKPVLRWKPIA